MRIPGVGRKLVVSEKCGLAMGEASEASGSSVSKGPEPLSQCVVLSTQLLLMLNDPYFFKN